jgi:hypothetical protein
MVSRACTRHLRNCLTTSPDDIVKSLGRLSHSIPLAPTEAVVGTTCAILQTAKALDCGEDLVAPLHCSIVGGPGIGKSSAIHQTAKCVPIVFPAIRTMVTTARDLAACAQFLRDTRELCRPGILVVDDADGPTDENTAVNLTLAEDAWPRGLCVISCGRFRGPWESAFRSTLSWVLPGGMPNDVEAVLTLWSPHGRDRFRVGDMRARATAALFSFGWQPRLLREAQWAQAPTLVSAAVDHLDALFGAAKPRTHLGRDSSMVFKCVMKTLVAENEGWIHSLSNVLGEQRPWDTTWEWNKPYCWTRESAREVIRDILGPGGQGGSSSVLQWPQWAHLMKSVWVPHTVHVDDLFAAGWLVRDCLDNHDIRYRRGPGCGPEPRFCRVYPTSALVLYLFAQTLFARE